MVTQRIANPFIPVRFWAWPPIKGKMDKEILKIALNTVNQEVPKSHTHYSRLKNSQCGDEIKIYMKVSKGKIVNLNYTGESCIYCQASASLLSRNIKNLKEENIEDLIEKAKCSFSVKKIENFKNYKKILKIMNINNARRKDCLLLPLKATLKALKN